MTQQDLLGQMSAIWYINDTFTLDTLTQKERDCAARRNVLPIVKQHLGKTDDLSGLVADQAGDIEVDDFIFSDPRSKDSERALDEAVEKMQASSMKPGSIELHDFIDVTSDKLSNNRFAYVGSALAIALAVDDDVSPEYWDQAHEDGLTPLQAVEQI